jgi:murein DD-endopeptidase MepM/ murein hydrolase activator NlpD
MVNFLKPCEGRVTSPFGYRIHPIKKTKSFHQGIDLAQVGNVPILAAANGVVTRNQSLGTYGNIVMIVHKIDGVTYETNYAHLKIGSKVIVGQRVKQGDVIGYMGNTGSSTAQHLHFEIHKGRWETGQPNAVDPLLYTSFPEIRYLQEKLNDIGYRLSEDGINGDNTTNAVKDFQAKQKLVVDGNAGPSTLAQLLKVFALANTPKPVVKPVIIPPKTEVNGVSKVEEYKKDAQPSKSLAKEFAEAVAEGLTDGTYPQRPMTREEGAVIALRVLKASRK